MMCENPTTVHGLLRHILCASFSFRDLLTTCFSRDWIMYRLKNVSQFISGRRRHRESQRAGRAAKHSQAIQGKMQREIEPAG